MTLPPLNATSVQDSLLQLLYDQVRDHAVFEVDAHGTFRSWNRSINRIFGYDADSFVGNNLAQLLPPEQRHPEEIARLLHEATMLGRSEHTLHFIRRNGQAFTGYTVMVPVPDGGLAVVVRDLSVLQATQEQLHALATVDQMTGLANRQHLFEMGRIEYRRWKRYKIPLSLLLVEVDHYSSLTLDQRPEAVDVLLCDVADILKQCVREVDMVAHAEGGIYTCLLPNTPQEGAAVLAERVRSALRKTTFYLEGKIVPLTASFVALTGVETITEFDGLMQLAHRTLAQARARGGDVVLVV